MTLRAKRATPEAVRRVATAGYDRALSAASQLAHRGYDIARTPIVLGTGRSGTTFLQELLCTAARTYPIFEPMSPYRDPDVAALGAPGGFIVRRPDEADERLRALLDEILRGRRLNRWSTRLQRTRGLMGAERFVVKEVKLTRCAGWIRTNFPQNRIVVIVRHPCAVVSSMLHARGLWRDWSSDHVRELLRGGYEQQADVIIRDEQPQFVRLAAFWAAETADVLRQTSPTDVLLITYEELMADPLPVLERTFAHLRLDVPPDLGAAIDRPSAMSTPFSAVRAGGDSLTAWQQRVADSDRDQILATVRAFGIDVYSSDPMPDRQRLRALHDGSARFD